MIADRKTSTKCVDEELQRYQGVIGDVKQLLMSTKGTFSINCKIEISGFGPLMWFTGQNEACSNLNQISHFPPLFLVRRSLKFLMNFLPDCDQE